MSIYPLLQCAEKEGIASAQILKDSSLAASQFKDPELMIPFAEELSVVKRYLRLSREPLPGLHVSEYYHYNCFGALGAALVSHASMLEACRFLSRYVALTFTPFHVVMKEDEQNLYARYIDRYDLAECREFYLLRDLAFIRNLCREADPEHWKKLVGHMHIAMQAPKAGLPIRDYFGWPLTFGAESTEIQASKEFLCRPLRLANAMTLKVMTAQCDQLLQARSPKSWQQRVENLLLDQGNLNELHEIAERLCCSERSLRRHLQKEGITLQEISNHLQQQRAIRYLCDTQLSIEVIATRLGYCETASFAHAFKRWTGITPSQYRRQGPETANGGPA